MCVGVGLKTRLSFSTANFTVCLAVTCLAYDNGGGVRAEQGRKRGEEEKGEERRGSEAKEASKQAGEWKREGRREKEMRGSGWGKEIRMRG